MAEPREAVAVESLTPREREVLALLREGLTDAEIGERLSVSRAGASYHVSQIIAKLGVRNRYEASVWPQRPPWWLRGVSPLPLLLRGGADGILRIAGVAVAVVLFAAVLGGLALLAFLLATGGGSQARPIEAHIVFVSDDQLWVAPADGSSPPRALTSSAVSAGYAGYVAHDDGSFDVFYVTQLGEARVQGDRFLADFALYRVAAPEGTAEEVLRYTGRPLEPFISSNASVSPDGRHVLYADDAGIVLLDLASRETRRVLENSPPCTGPADCFAYHYPRFSPQGDRALVTKTLWEGARDVVIDPFASPPGVIETPGGAAFAATWSPDGSRVCVSQETYATSGAALVYDIETGEAVDATVHASVPDVARIGRVRFDTRGCAWARDGRLAFGYIIAGVETSARIAVVDESFTLLAESEPAAQYGAVVSWLPDGSGVLYNGGRAETGEVLPPGIYVPGAGARPLPFEADAIAGVIP